VGSRSGSEINSFGSATLPISFISPLMTLRESTVRYITQKSPNSILIVHVIF